MDLKDQAAMFRMQKPMEEVPAEWNLLQGMKCPMAGMPIFTWFNDTKAPCLYRDDLFSLYLNHAPPYPKLLADPARAGMSFCHMLAVPMERIYNAATLQPGDEHLIKHMRDKVKELMDDCNFRARVASAIRDKYLASVNSEQLLATFSAQLNQFLSRTNGDSMDFYFHVHPHHSVGHLHMHCLHMGMLTDTWDLLKYKNVRYSDVYIP
ncbi:hypothetical protein EBT31_03510 [bacterium]|nr:hypothetical protein [bacterium]NBX48688.1 hypothetical protein [bacterium]